MSGETQEWRDAAVELFDSFGDVVKDVTLTIPSGAKAFDPSTGTNAASTTSATSKIAIVMLGQTKFQKVFGPNAAYVETNKTAYMLPPSAGTLVIGTEVEEDVSGLKYTIDRLADPNGIQAYFMVYLRPVAA